jgi:hypothetical protein
LLSDGFAQLHCFSLVSGEGDRSGYVGLAFQPDVTRELPDIAGVLWLDARTAELRYLDFSYTRLPYEIELENVGGREEFERLPSGPWIVRRWWIRMPILASRNRAFSDFARESYLAALKEDGGYVSEIRTLDDELVLRRGVVSLSGTVLNLHTAQPVAGADVILVGTGYSVETDATGGFRFGYLEEGTYRVSLGPRTLDVLGYVPPLVEVTLTIDEPQFITLAIPSITRLWSQLCPRSNAASGVGIVSGFVRDAARGIGLPGAQVIIHQPVATVDSIRSLDRVGDSMTDWAGYFRVCDIPTGDSVAVEARRAGATGVTADTTMVHLTPGDIIRVDFALPEPSDRDRGASSFELVLLDLPVQSPLPNP